MKRIKARIGDRVSFERKDMIHIGIVFKVNDRSVLVDIKNESREHLDYKTSKTVVGHNNYRILCRKECENIKAGTMEIKNRLYL